MQKGQYNNMIFRRAQLPLKQSSRFKFLAKKTILLATLWISLGLGKAEKANLADSATQQQSGRVAESAASALKSRDKTSAPGKGTLRIIGGQQEKTAFPWAVRIPKVGKLILYLR
jgi:hypothetical protein